MMLDSLISVYSPTPVLTKMSERIFSTYHPIIGWSTESDNDRLLKGDFTYIPIQTEWHAHEFAAQGGHLLWLGANVHTRRNSYPEGAIVILGVNSFVACQFAVSVGIRQIREGKAPYRELQIYILPQTTNLLKNFV